MVEQPILDLSRLGDKKYRDWYNGAFLTWSIAAQVRDKRLALNWTIKILAEKSGLHWATIRRVESGKTLKFSNRTLLKIAGAFDCALVVKFVCWEDFIAIVLAFTPDGLVVESFDTLEQLVR